MLGSSRDSQPCTLCRRRTVRLKSAPDTLSRIVPTNSHCTVGVTEDGDVPEIMRIQTALDRLCVRFFRRRMQKMPMPDVDGDVRLKEDHYTSRMVNQTSRKDSILAKTNAEPMQEEDWTGGVRRAFALSVFGW